MNYKSWAFRLLLYLIAIHLIISTLTMEFTAGFHNVGKFQQGINLASLVALALLMLGVFCTLKMIFRKEEKNHQYYAVIIGFTILTAWRVVSLF